MSDETSKKKKGKKVGLIVGIIAAVIIVIGIIGAIVAKQIAKKMSDIPGMGNNGVQVETVEYRDLSESISLSGTVAGQGQANITSSAEAEVLTVNVSVGDTVKKGDVICTLKQEDIEKQIEQLKKAKENADKLDAMQREDNQDALDDAKDSGAKLVAQAKKALKSAENSYTTTKEKIAEDKDDLKEAKASVKEAKSVTAEAKKKMDADSDAYTKATTAYDNANNALKLMDKSDAGYKTQADKVQKLYETMNKAKNTYTASKGKYETAKLTSDGIEESIDLLEAEIAQLEESLPELQDAIDEAKEGVTDAEKQAKDGIKTAQDAITSAGLSNDSEDTTSEQLEELEKQLDDCTVKATTSGIITAVNVKPGDLNSGATPIVTIENVDYLVVRATVSEDDILKLKEGMKATVTCNALPDREIEGEVTRVVRVIGNDASDMWSDSSSFAVEVTIKDPDILIGMTAKVKIFLSDDTEALAIPYDVIRYDDNGASYVLIGEDAGNGKLKAVKCPVTLGAETDYYVSVTGGDLQVGDQLIYDYSVNEGDTFEPMNYDPTSLNGGEEMDNGADAGFGVDTMEVFE